MGDHEIRSTWIPTDCGVTRSHSPTSSKLSCGATGAQRGDHSSREVLGEKVEALEYSRSRKVEVHRIFENHVDHRGPGGLGVVSRHLRTVSGIVPRRKGRPARPARA